MIIVFAVQVLFDSGYSVQIIPNKLSVHSWCTNISYKSEQGGTHCELV